MQITVNSQLLDVPAPVTVAGLIAHLGLPATRVAVELNRHLVRRADHGTTLVADGDHLEVVTLVGGGSSRDLETAR